MKMTATKITSLFMFAILAWMAHAPVWADAVGVPFSQNLQADAQLAKSRGVPLLVMFSSPNCTYCERVLNEFLLPMQRNPDYAKKVLMRQVEVGSDRKLIDFKGKTTTNGGFAVQHNVMLSPTVIVFDYQGNEAADPVVGLGTVDYYGSFLDNAIDAGLAKVRAHVSAQRLN
jgi:thioredoxin-related protein